MRSRNSEIFYPENLLEAQNILKDYPDSRIIAGGTGYFFSETDRCFDLPEFILSTKKLAELKGISKTERYIDIGAGVSLNKLLSLGKKNIPETAMTVETPKISNANLLLHAKNRYAHKAKAHK